MGVMKHTCITWKCEIGINLNFGNKLIWFVSSDSCHKKILQKSLNIPLTIYNGYNNQYILIQLVHISWWISIHASKHTETWSLFRTDVPGGTQIWFGQGYAARASKPLPIFKGHFGREGYPCKDFFFWKIGPFFTNFAIFKVFAMQKPKLLGSVRQLDPCLMTFL